MGNYKCASPVDRQYSIGANQYCNVTPDTNFFAWLTQGTIARNHLEVGIDTRLIDAEPVNPS